MQRARARLIAVSSLLGLVVLVAALGACGGGASPAPATEGEVREIEVIADNLKFNPATIAVQKGERVRFTVTSKDIFHTFTFRVDGREINLDLQAGDTKSADVLVFDEPGEIVYWCKPHQALGMEGKLNITGQ